MKGIDIEKVREERYLGVIIDSELKFHTKYSTVVNKANQHIGTCNHTGIVS